MAKNRSLAVYFRQAPRSHLITLPLRQTGSFSAMLRSPSAAIALLLLADLFVLGAALPDEKIAPSDSEMVMRERIHH